MNHIDSINLRRVTGFGEEEKKKVKFGIFGHILFSTLATLLHNSMVGSRLESLVMNVAGLRKRLSCFLGKLCF